MNTNEYTGYWWLPSLPDNQITGTIKITNENKITLELLGVLQKSGERLNIFANEFLNNKSHEIILGLTIDGKLITICQANCCNSNYNFSGWSSEKYNIAYFLIGVHFSKLEEMKFFKALVKYSHLSMWTYLGNPEFLKSFNHQFFEEKNTSYSDLPELTAKTAKGEIKIHIGEATQSKMLNLEVTKKKTSTIGIYPLQELSFEEYYNDYLYPLQNFLTLATNQQNLVTELILFSHHGKKIDYPYHDSSEEPIKVIARFIYEKDNEENQVSPIIIFSLKDIENEFSLYIQKWLNITDEIKHICNIYFGLKYNKSIGFTESYFLFMSQAVESYHRVKKNNLSIPLEAHQKRLKEIYDTIPENYLDWLKEKLAHSNELTLKDRLEQLITIHKGIIQPFLHDENNINNFIKRVRNTRNYYTHYNQSLNGKYAQGSELFRLAQVLSFLLLACLLSELGCTNERCVELVSRCNDYQFTVHFVKEEGFQW